MSRLYAESNGETSRELFNKKFRYKRKIMKSVAGNRNIVDFTIGEKKLYGKVDAWYSPMFVEFDGRLKTLKKSDSEQPLRALNFVADLFNQMTMEFERCMMTGQIDRADPFLSSLKAYKAYESPMQGYREYKKILFNSIKQKFLSHDINVENFEHFLEEFMKLSMIASKSTPFTFAGYIKSDINTIMSSGLAIEIADLRYDDDDEKIESLLKSKNWKFFVNACNKHGFIIDYNVPWRIVCDVKAPEINLARGKYYLTTTALFEQGFSRPSIHSLIALPKELLELYNLVVKKRFKKKVTCGKRVTTKVISPPRDYTVAGIMNTYGLEHFFKIYMKLRLSEEKPEMDTEQKRFLIKDVLQYLRLRDDYGILETYFERFINKPFDKRYSMTYNMNTVLPARQKYLEDKSLAYSAASIKQAVMSY